MRLMAKFAIRPGVYIDPAVKLLEMAEDGYAAEYQDLYFIVSINTEKDGKRWLHASVSRKDGTLPNYQDLKKLKSLCIGEDKTALQVFPPATKFVNIYEVLHLWTCLDGDVTPDFTRGGKTI